MIRGHHSSTWVWLAVAFAVALFSTCSEDPTAPLEDQTESRELWMGTYADSTLGDSGVLVIELFRKGETVTGEVVLVSQMNERPNTHFYVKGSSLGKDLSLALDSSRIPGTYRYQVTIKATRSESPGLSGVLTYSVTGLNAGVECDAVPFGALETVQTVELSTHIRDLAFDGNRIWVSTMDGNYQRFDMDGALLDRIPVYYLGQYLWTSDALTSDGTHLWGILPGTVQTPDTSIQVSWVQEFDLDGEIVRDFRTDHRSWGLAVDGGDLWSLELDPRRLHRIDKDGAILETIAVDVPDLIELEFDGTHFWGAGYWLHRLYQIDKQGNTIRVFDPPDNAQNNTPRGIAFDGIHLWYVADAATLSDFNKSRIQKLRVVDL